MTEDYPDDRMVRYQVQLETPDETFNFEVVTDDFDASELARIALADLIGADAAEAAHMGGYADIGTGDEVEVLLVRRTTH